MAATTWQEDVLDVLNGVLADAAGSPVDAANSVLPSFAQIPLGTSTGIRSAMGVPADMGASKELAANLIGLLAPLSAGAKAELTAKNAFVHKRLQQESDRQLSGYGNLSHDSGLLQEPANGLPYGVLSVSNPRQPAYMTSNVVNALNQKQAAEIASRKLPLHEAIFNPGSVAISNQGIQAPLVLNSMTSDKLPTQQTYNVLYDLLMKNALVKGK